MSANPTEIVACAHCGQSFQRDARAERPHCSFACKFWSLVVTGDNDDCWIWQGKRNVKGYGIIQIDGVRQAHRHAWSLNAGEPAPADKLVLHSCDNPPCCNPRHLRLGTRHDNMQDAVKRRRHLNSRKDICKRGHPLAGDNLIIKTTGHRNCRRCVNDRKAARRQRHAA